MATPATLASVEELADWIGETLNPTRERRRATMCLRVASALVRKESGRTWLEEDESLVDPIPEEVKMVTLYCASRVFDNRNAQTRGGLDDYSESWKVDESGAYLTASEKRMLAQFQSAGTPGIGVITTTRLSVVEPSGFVPTGTPDVYFPWY